jgi:hypothetical protein
MVPGHGRIGPATDICSAITTAPLFDGRVLSDSRYWGPCLFRNASSPGNNTQLPAIHPSRGPNRERNGNASCLDRSLYADFRRHGLCAGPHFLGILQPVVRVRERRRQRAGLQLSHFPAMPRCCLRIGLLLRESDPVSMPPVVSCQVAGPASTVRRRGLARFDRPPHELIWPASSRDRHHYSITSSAMSRNS